MPLHKDNIGFQSKYYVVGVAVVAMPARLSVSNLLLMTPAANPRHQRMIHARRGTSGSGWHAKLLGHMRSLMALGRGAARTS